MNKKISLVLEGGGMRGAYTAGCLSWLIDENIEFDAAYGISTGAVHLASFLMKSKEFLFEMSTNVIADKSVIGLSPLVKEGMICSYNRMFDHYLKEVLHFDIENLKRNTNTDAYFGVYDLGLGETVYIPLDDMNMNILKACTSLPLIGKVVKEKDKRYLDGGITKMIPIEKAVEDGCTDHLIITTKPFDYIRKPSNGAVVKLMSLVYKDCSNIGKDYAIRHKNYNKQIAIINELEKNRHALYRYPTKTIPVSRLKGDKADLRALYQLGREDMENSREAVYKLIKK